MYREQFLALRHIFILFNLAIGKNEQNETGKILLQAIAQ